MKPSDLTAQDRAQAVARRALGVSLPEIAAALGCSPKSFAAFVRRGEAGTGSGSCVAFAAQLSAAAESKLSQDDVLKLLEGEAREERGTERRQRARIYLHKLARERDAERAVHDRPPTPYELLMRELRRPRTAAELAAGAAKQAAWENGQTEKADAKANQKGPT